MQNATHGCTNVKKITALGRCAYLDRGRGWFGRGLDGHSTQGRRVGEERRGSRSEREARMLRRLPEERDACAFRKIVIGFDCYSSEYVLFVHLVGKCFESIGKVAGQLQTSYEDTSRSLLCEDAWCVCRLELRRGGRFDRLGIDRGCCFRRVKVPKQRKYRIKNALYSRIEKRLHFDARDARRKKCERRRGRGTAECQVPRERPHAMRPMHW